MMERAMVMVVLDNAVDVVCMRLGYKKRIHLTVSIAL